MGRQRPDRRVGVRRDQRGASEVIGLSLVLVVSMVATGLVLAQGGGAFLDGKQGLDVNRNEQALTVLDNRASLVALSGAPDRHISLGNAGDGSYRIEEDAGWLRIVHHNYTAGANEELYNGTLGAVVYENGESEVAYQGGGVFRKHGDGSVMVSPPEFHYRDDTLTLPVVQVRGEGQAAGQVSATVGQDGYRPNQVFPNKSTTYGGSGESYHNPITDGSVIVTVHSEYYQGWAQFFEVRTEGIVTVYDSNETVSVELTTLGTHGIFDMPAEGNAVEVRGLAPHGVQNFTVVLRPDNSDAARFNNLQWSFRATGANREMEIHLRLTGPANDPTTACKEQNIAATVYFSDANGDPYHGWHDPSAFRTSCYERGDDTLNDEIQLVANLTSTATTLTMGDLDQDDLEYFNPSSATAKSTVTFGHGDVDAPGTFSTGDSVPIGLLVNHYLSEMGRNIDLYVEDKNSDTIQEDDSWGNLQFEGRGQIAYLYVSENAVEIEL